MKNQTRISILATLVLAATTAGTAAMYKLGEDAHVRFLADVGLVYQDNLFLSPDSLEEDDLQLVFTPGVELVMGSKASSTTLSYKHMFSRYDDNSELNDDFAQFNLVTKYDSGRTYATASASYREEYSNTYGVDNGSDIFGVLVKRDFYNMSGMVKYGLSELTALSGGLDYTKVNYDLPFYADQESYAVPVTFYYNIRPKIDLTAGLRYRNTDTSIGLEYDDMYYYVGAVGELFSPVIYADLSIGYQEREEKNDLIPSEGSAAYSLSFIYTGNPKSKAYLTVARDYRTSAYSALAYAWTSATLGANYTLSNLISFDGSIAFGTAEYDQSPREEDITMLRVGANYHPNDYLTVSAGYVYRDVDGNIANYTTNEIRVTASLRY
jgi:hypothetical protein